MSDVDFSRFKATNCVEEYDNIPSSKDSTILYSPIRVYFDLTLECNLRCRTCLNRSGDPAAYELTPEEAIKVVEGVADDYIFDIRFSGGEPTLKESWDEILNRTKEIGLTVSLNSNGIYNDTAIERLVEINPDEITISIDGCKENNDYIRGRGSFEKAVRSIKELSSAGCRVTINSVVTSILGERDIRTLLELADEFCDDISFFHARPIGRAVKIKDKLLNYEELSDFMARVEQMKREYPHLNIRTRSSSLKDNSISHANATDFGLMEGGTDGFTRFNITPTGDFYAGGCVPYVDQNMREQLVLGNIVNENFSLLNVWRSNKRLKQIREESVRLKERCKKCIDYKSSCSGFTLDMELYRRLHAGENPYCRIR